MRFLYFSASSNGKLALAFFQRLALIKGEEADYAYTDVLDVNGALAGERAVIMDSLDLCNQARSELFEKNRLVAMLAQIDGIDDLTMTTNGYLLPQKARALKDAGLAEIWPHIWPLVIILVVVMTIALRRYKATLD
ncbi:MAG: hypothetical protein IH996_10420 [Proteobacteria bacterium]|nr:hypothetical protein [Pseudomonadota bacterium]